MEMFLTVTMMLVVIGLLALAGIGIENYLLRKRAHR